jgi:hypothetical protein
MKWYLRACPVCRGDLHDDPEKMGWEICIMFGRWGRAPMERRQPQTVASMRAVSRSNQEGLVGGAQVGRIHSRRIT